MKRLDNDTDLVITGKQKKYICAPVASVALASEEYLETVLNGR